MEEWRLVLGLEAAVVGLGARDEGVGLPDELETLAADGVDEAGGDAGAAGFAGVVDEQDLFACGSEALGEDAAGEAAAEDDCGEWRGGGGVW